MNCYMATAAVWATAIVPVPAADRADPDWAGAQIVLTGILTGREDGPTGLSFPPMYTGRLTFRVEEVLRGDVAAGQPLVLHFTRRQEQPPEFPVGRLCLVTAAAGRGTLTALTVEPADAAAVDAARTAMAIPIGWTRQGNEWISPWADLGEAAWPKQASGRSPCCARTGRPALMAGAGVTLAVEPVPPAKSIRWTNPDGDGEYRVTVSNATDKAVAVPALLRHGGRILWEESLVIRCQGKTYRAPGSRGVDRPPEPVVLGPRESVSTGVNILRLDGPAWPRGGSRVEFQFCLGERSAIQSFYYMSRHHDRLREDVRAAR